MQSPRLFLLLLGAYGLASSSLATVLLTVSDRRVPLLALSPWVASLAGRHLVDHLFELGQNHTLYGTRGAVHFDQCMARARLLRRGRHENVYVDGLWLPPSLEQPFWLYESSIIDEDKACSVSVAADGHIAFISLPKMHLIAVDSVTHPGLFINTQVQTQQANNSKSEFESKPDSDALVLLNESTTRAVRTHGSWGSCKRGQRQRIFQVALVSDSSFCAQYGTRAGTIHKLRLLLDKAERAYRDVSCLRLEGVLFNVNCAAVSDPYRETSGLPGATRLKAMRNIFEKSVHSEKVRDVVTFLTGNQLGTTTGSAYIAGACSTSGFTWTSARASRAESNVVKTLAHELGHSMGLLHHSSGVMTQGGAATSFSPSSMSMLHAILRSSVTNCIAPRGKSADDVVAVDTCGGVRMDVAVECSVGSSGLLPWPVVARLGWMQLGKGNRYVAVKLRRRTVYGRLELSLEAPAPRTVAELDGEVTFEIVHAIVTVGLQGTTTRFMPSYGRARKHNWSLPLDALARRKGGNRQCCGAANWLRVAVQMEFRGSVGGRIVAKTDVAQTVALLIGCKRCVKGGRLMAMAADRRCPVCSVGGPWGTTVAGRL